MILPEKRAVRRVCLLLTCLAAACAGSDASPPPTDTAPPTDTSSTLLPDTTPPRTDASSTLSPDTSPPPTAEPALGPRPLSELFAADTVAWSLPPLFGAVGSAMPIAVEVALEAEEIVTVDIVDMEGVPLTSLTRAGGRFWFGEIPADALVGEQLTVRAVARLVGNDEMVSSADRTVRLLPAAGTVLQVRRVEPDVSSIPIDADELAVFVPDGDGDVGGPAAIARVGPDEVAVVDSENRRVACFGLDGSLRCDIAVTVHPDGDLLPLGDGTLLLVDVESNRGEQGVRLFRIDPASGDTDVVFEEDPLVIDGFPAGVATNSTFRLDRSTGTAWLGIPEVPGTDELPDPARYLVADAFALDTPVTRGPTVVRAAFRPDASAGGLAVVDGGAWARLDGIGPRPSVLTREITPNGSVVMLVGWADEAGATSGIVRWRPGEPVYEFAEIEYEFFGGSTTRVMAALDEDRLVVMDQGTRLRLVVLPTID